MVDAVAIHGETLRPPSVPLATLCYPCLSGGLGDQTNFPAAVLHSGDIDPNTIIYKFLTP